MGYVTQILCYACTQLAEAIAQAQPPAQPIPGCWPERTNCTWEAWAPFCAQALFNGDEGLARMAPTVGFAASPANTKIDNTAKAPEADNDAEITLPNTLCGALLERFHGKDPHALCTGCT